MSLQRPDAISRFTRVKRLAYAKCFNYGLLME